MEGEENSESAGELGRESNSESIDEVDIDL